MRYDDEEEKFKYKIEYNYADLDLKSYRDEISILKKALPQTVQKSDCFAKICYGKEYNNNLILIKREEKK